MISATYRVPSTAPGARFTTYGVTVTDGTVTKCECKGWRFHGHCKHARNVQAMVDAVENMRVAETLVGQ